MTKECLSTNDSMSQAVLKAAEDCRSPNRKRVFNAQISTTTKG